MCAWALSVLRDGAGADQEVAALLVVGVAVSVLLLVALAYSRALIGALAIWRPRPRQQGGGDAFDTWWS